MYELEKISLAYICTCRSLYLTRSKVNGLDSIIILIGYQKDTCLHEIGLNVQNCKLFKVQ